MLAASSSLATCTDDHLPPRTVGMSRTSALDHYNLRKRKAFGDFVELRANTRQFVRELLPDLDALDSLIETPNADRNMIGCDEIGDTIAQFALDFVRKESLFSGDRQRARPTRPSRFHSAGALSQVCPNTRNQFLKHNFSISGSP
jgi:hypothetical protein